MSDAIHSEERAEDWTSTSCSAFFGCSEMPAQRFTLELYCSRVGYSSTEGWDVVNDRVKKGFVMTGWTWSEKLFHLRPNNQGFAVMMYQEPRTERILRSSETRQVGGEEFWMHIPWPNESGQPPAAEQPNTIDR